MNRKDFLLRSFRKDIDDPLIYHLTINVSRLSFDKLVRSIVEAVKLKYPNNKSQITASVKFSKQLTFYT